MVTQLMPRWGLPARCTACGLQFETRIIVSPNVTVQNMGTNCPRCNGMAIVQDGTYHIVSQAVRAFSAPGVTREQIVRLRDVAKDVRGGAVTVANGSEQLQGIAAPLVALWAATNKNSGALSVLLAIITLFLMIYYEQASDEQGSRQDRSAERQMQIQQQILEELKRQNLAVPAPETPRPTTPAMPPATQQQKPPAAKQNRQERRKAAAKARQNRPKPER